MKNLTGKVVGRLLCERILSDEERPEGGGGIWYACVCRDCGERYKVRNSTLADFAKRPLRSGGCKRCRTRANITPQDAEMAVLAASGKTLEEIATRFHVKRAAVAYRLARYRKAMAELNPTLAKE